MGLSQPTVKIFLKTKLHQTEDYNNIVFRLVQYALSPLKNVTAKRY